MTQSLLVGRKGVPQLSESDIDRSSTNSSQPTIKRTLPSLSVLTQLFRVSQVCLVVEMADDRY